MSPVVIVTRVGAAEGAKGAAAALACAGAEVDLATLFVEVGGRAPRPTLIATAAARRLEERLLAHLPPEARVAARGQVCHLAVPDDSEGHATASAAATVARGAAVAVLVPAQGLQALLADGPSATAVLLRADLGRDRALTALVAADLIDRGFALAVLKRRLSWVSERRALFGALGNGGAGGGLPAAVVRRLGVAEQPALPLDLRVSAA